MQIPIQDLPPPQQQQPHQQHPATQQQRPQSRGQPVSNKLLLSRIFAMTKVFFLGKHG